MPKNTHDIIVVGAGHNGLTAASYMAKAGLDVLVLDCLRPAHHPTHFSIDEAVEVAQRIAARQTYFVHMSHEIDHGSVSSLLPTGMELAYDGLTVPLS